MLRGANGIEGFLQPAQDGTREALGRAFVKCQAYLAAVARQELDPRLRSKGEVADLVQETFLKAYQHFDQFRGRTEAQLLGWLRQILRNNLADFSRRYHQVKRRLAAEVTANGRTASAVQLELLCAATRSPSEEAIANEEACLLEHALDCLPEDYRQVLHLRHLEQYSFAEIGRRMDRSANAVEKLCLRAALRLGREMRSSNSRD
jgi:RNA polymerase sigma-70 factor (ECF subfamily)